MKTVAALYIDPRGPYPKMESVDCWDAERDARHYPGPHPIVAHPPCGPWGQLAHMCTKQDKTLAPLAVEQLIRWGGVLEHPHTSRLFSELGLPLPGGLPQVRGGRLLWSITVDQVRWGHVCRKRTTLLFADVDPRVIRHLPPDREPTHDAASFGWKRNANLKAASKELRRRTPPEFAQWLVDAVREGFIPPKREPVAAVTNSDRPYLQSRRRASGLEVRATPPLFSEWLVSLVRTLEPS